MCQADRDCIERCLDGHPEAYRHLVGRYQAVLLSYLAGRLGDRERAEEAAQEAFVRAYFALGKLNKPESFFSWLLGIASRVAKEQQREERRHQQVAHVLGRRAADPELSNDYALERAVAELPELYRQVVLLRYYGGLSCGQVARQMGTPLGTVTKQLSRAYHMLRQSLRQQRSDWEHPEVRS